MRIPGLPRRRHRLGCTFDERDHRDRDIDEIGLPSSGLPAHALFENHIAELRDQRNTNSCVGQAFAGWREIADSLAGDPVVRRSSLFVYANARVDHGAIRRDLGTRPRSALKGISRCGMAPQESWPFSSNPATVMRQPPMRAYMEAHAGRILRGYYRIADKGEQRLVALKAALANQRPIFFATSVTESFLDDGGPIEIDRPALSDRVVGGHAMLLLGYQETDDGLRFRALNSWGRDWRDDGLAWVTADFMTSNDTRDMWVLEPGNYNAA